MLYVKFLLSKQFTNQNEKSLVEDFTAKQISFYNGIKTGLVPSPTLIVGLTVAPDTASENNLPSFAFSKTNPSSASTSSSSLFPPFTLTLPLV